MAELDYYGNKTKGRILTSLFFGGGTPSLMPPATVEALIAAAQRHWQFAPDIEITLEANPGTAEAGRFQDFRAAGINRLSLGIQSFKDEALKFLGRIHSAREGLDAIGLAARIFDRFSFDLIYALPGQSLEDWEAELARALSLAGDHLSLYQLTLEEGTHFWLLGQRGEIRLPEEEEALALFEATQEITAAENLSAYEISNHARPGGESRHNLLYWRGDDYVGIGPGAHGRLTLGGEVFATRQHRAPDIWLGRALAGGHATQEETGISAEERIQELVLMGLRLTEGIDRANFRKKTGRHLEDCLKASALGEFREAGLLILDSRGLRTSPAGRPLLNAMLARLLA